VNILQPGPGVGGHCIAVDPWFIVSKTPDEAKLMHTARKVNNTKPDWVVEKIKEAVANYLRNHPNKSEQDVTIACLGITFKPNIDDVRESPALSVFRKVTAINKGITLAVEPNVNCFIDGVNLVTLNEAIKQADILIRLVAHDEFKCLESIISSPKVYLSFV
jgi:UDP-N-acetyl-D-mannosaminuronic acid dehydrogenase